MVLHHDLESLRAVKAVVVVCVDAEDHLRHWILELPIPHTSFWGITHFQSCLSVAEIYCLHVSFMAIKTRDPVATAIGDWLGGEGLRVLWMGETDTLVGSRLYPHGNTHLCAQLQRFTARKDASAAPLQASSHMPTLSFPARAPFSSSQNPGGW